MLIDSDVLIWMTRGHPAAAARLQALLPWRISAVTYIELAQGCRNQQELTWVKKGLADRQTQIIALSESADNAHMRCNALRLLHPRRAVGMLLSR
jgi:predicted nucleic acid-binding protein